VDSDTDSDDDDTDDNESSDDGDSEEEEDDKIDNNDSKDDDDDDDNESSDESNDDSDKEDDDEDDDNGESAQSRSKLLLKLRYAIGQTVECKTGPEDDDWEKGIITKLNYTEEMNVNNSNSSIVPYQVRLFNDDEDNNNEYDNEDDNENKVDSDRYVFAPKDTSDYIRKPRRKFHEYINCWIPIATYAVMECTENQLRLCNNNKYNAFDIIAIYGNQDKEGMVVSKRLEEYSDAKIEKLNGRHPVYLDSPDEFVPTIGWAIV